MSQLLEFANNNALLVTGTLLMALAVVFYEIRQRGRTVFELSPSRVVQLMNQGAVVLDVRDAEKYESGHIVGAISLPKGDLSAKAAKQIKKNKQLILVCDTGVTSARCLDAVRQAGYETAFSLEGGLAAWQRENLPTIAGSKP